MEDPFGLLEITNKRPSQEEKPKIVAKKAYLTVISILVIFSLALVTLFIVQNQASINADVLNPSVSIKVTNLPSVIKTGDTISLNLVFTNSGDNLTGAYALIQAKGINIVQTIDQAKKLTQDQDGYLRKLDQTEFNKFDNKGDSGVYYKIGSLKGGQSNTLNVKAIVTSGSGADSNIEAKLIIPKYAVTKCGFLNIKQCQSEIGVTQVASGTFQISPEESGKIKLRKGFNYISLPYVFTSSSLSDFFSALKSKWAYVFVPSTGEYLNLLTGDNSSKIKPGVGFWLYDSNGGEYDLPTTRVETNINETYSIPLDIGWNQVGNPYSKRMILSGAKIMVRELGADGSESGTAYDLKTAIANGTLSDPYLIVYPNATDASSNMKTVKGFLDNNIDPFSGFLIKSTKKINLIIPGKEVIAPGDVVSATERAKIESWISESGLNQYADPNGTVYAGGTPLYDEATGQTLDRLDYILAQHPDRPWNK